MDKLISDGQVMSWYHSKILRIPHGKQNPTKRYLTDSQILELFDGLVTIQEKVDGKLSIDLLTSENCNYNKSWDIIEDMTGKNTCHNHIMKYNQAKLPYNKRISLDRVFETSNSLHFEIPFMLGTQGFSPLTYTKINFEKPQYQ